MTTLAIITGLSSKCKQDVSLRGVVTVAPEVVAFGLGIIRDQLMTVQEKKNGCKNLVYVD